MGQVETTHCIGEIQLVEPDAYSEPSTTETLAPLGVCLKDRDLMIGLDEKSFPLSRFLLLGFLWLGILTGLQAADPPKAVAKEKLHLYLLIGQSNMAGRGVLDDEAKVEHPRVLMFTKENQWAPAMDPLHFDKPIAGVGLGSSFGRAMAEADPKVTIGLVPCAVGGTPISRWQKGADLYEQAKVRIQAAMKEGTLKGVLWHQGESDSGEEQRALNYGGMLSAMIRDWRSDLESTELPLVLGQLGPFLPDTKKGNPTFYHIVNDQLQKVAEADPQVSLASSEGLTDKGDGVHFDTASLREFGQRYAKAMQELQKGE